MRKFFAKLGAWWAEKWFQLKKWYYKRTTLDLNNWPGKKVLSSSETRRCNTVPHTGTIAEGTYVIGEKPIAPAPGQMAAAFAEAMKNEDMGKAIPVELPKTPQASPK